MKKLLLFATALTLGLAVSTTTLHAKCGDGKDGKACCKKGSSAKGGKACCKKKDGEAAKTEKKAEASKKTDAKKSN